MILLCDAGFSRPTVVIQGESIPMQPGGSLVRIQLFPLEAISCNN